LEWRCFITADWSRRWVVAAEGAHLGLDGLMRSGPVDRAGRLFILGGDLVQHRVSPPIVDLSSGCTPFHRHS
jgi:hypothetical protein